MDARLQRRVQRYCGDKAVDDYEAGWQGQLEAAQSLMIVLVAPAPRGRPRVASAVDGGRARLRIAAGNQPVDDVGGP